MKAGTKERELGRVPLFSGCRTDQLRWIARHADVIEVPSDAVLCREGRTAKEFVVVLSGAAVGDADTNVVYGPGAHFGAVGLLEPGTHPQTVVALSPMRIAVLDARSFTALLSRVPAVATKLLRELALQVRYARAGRAVALAPLAG